MKKLLALALVAVMAGAAMAQPGVPGIGFFFGTENLPIFDPYQYGEDPHPATITPAGTFWAHVVVIGIEDYSVLAGYEFGTLVPAEDDDFFPMGGWDYMGIGAGIDATHPDVPGSYCRAHGYTVPREITTNYMVVMKARFRNFYAAGHGEWWLGPWGVTTIMPKIVVDGVEMNVPVAVADYDGGWVVCAGAAPGTVATEPMSWTNVKSLFN